MVQLKGLFKLAPSLAIKYFKNKNNKFSWDWYELWQDAHKELLIANYSIKELHHAG